MAGHLSGAAEFIQQRAVANFTKCDAEYGRRLSEALNKDKKQKVIKMFQEIFFILNKINFLLI